MLAGSCLLVLLVLTTVLTPDIAKRVVKIDEQARVNGLALKVVGIPEDQIPGKLAQLGAEFVKVAPQPGRAEVSVEIPGTHSFLVSERPLSSWEARRVLRPPGRRMGLGILACCATLYILAHLLASYVLKPVTQLTEAVRAISEGERGVAVPVPAEVELARLARDFNQMSQDLTQREQELHQALEAKDKIFATTSHELRTPLTVVLGYCQMLQEGLKGPLTPEQDKSVSVIRRNAQSLLQQVEVLLTLSQLRSRSLPFQRQSVDLREMVHELIEELSPLAEKKGLALASQLPEQPVKANLDYRHGCQIARNLLANAIKFTEQGTVTVSLESEPVPILVVADTGPGIEADFQESLFQEFARGPHTEGVEGTGLGLALSRKLARGMDGEVELRSSGPEGSVFCWKVQL